MDRFFADVRVLAACPEADARLHRYSNPHAGTRHRRLDGRLRRRRRRHPAAVSVSRHAEHHAADRAQSRERAGDVGVVVELPRLESGAGRLPRDRRVPHRGAESRRDRQPGASFRRAGVGIGVRHDGDRAGARPRVQRVRRRGRCQPHRRRQRAAVADAIRRTRGFVGFRHAPEQRAVPCRRHHAARDAVPGAGDRRVAAARAVREDVSAAGRAPRPHGGRPAEARRHDRAGALDDGRHRPAPRDAVPRFQQGQHRHRHVVSRRDRREHPSGDDAAARGRRAARADRLRQSCQPVARADGGAAAGADASRCARRRSRQADSSVAARSRDPGGGRRRARRSRGVRRDPHLHRRSAEHDSAYRSHRHRLARPGLRRSRVARDGDSVRRPARAACVETRSAEHPARRPQRLRPARPASAPRARRRPARGGDGAPHRRRPGDEEPGAAQRDPDRLRPESRHHPAAHAA